MSFKPQPYFRYTPLDQSQDSFRLCKLLPGEYQAPVECELFHDKISGRSDVYYALSYTWGESKGPRWIRLNGKPFHVQPNLFAGLKAIRKADTEIIIWIDALCINQLADGERNHQVSLMGSIYGNAKEVLAWVGPAADDSDFLLAYTKKHYGAKDHGKYGEKREIPNATKEHEEQALCAFNDFIKRDYWHRAWIIQEITLAKDVTIHCGSSSVDGFRFFLMGGYNFAVGNSKNTAISNMFIHRSNLENGEPENLEQLLYRYKRTNCTDPRDRIFSLLSLAYDCSGNEEKFADYNISKAAIYFALLSIIKPANIVKLTATLHYVLEVRLVELFEFWMRVSTDEIPKSKSPLEETAMVYVWAVKNMLESPEFKAWKTCPSAKALAEQHSVESSSETEWLMRCCLLAQGETNRAEPLVVRIENSNFCIFGGITLFGFVCHDVMEKVDDPQPTSDGRSESEWRVYNPSIEEEILEKASLLVEHVNNPGINLSKVKPRNFFDQYATTLLGAVAEAMNKEASVAEICKVLVALNRCSPFNICLTVCRYFLTELHGYVLVPPEGRKIR